MTDLSFEKLLSQVNGLLLAKLAPVLEVMPVTTATIERTFDSMKVIKKRLCSRIGEQTLNHAMQICIERPETLSAKTLDVVLDHYKGTKKRRMP